MCRLAVRVTILRVLAIVALAEWVAPARAADEVDPELKRLIAVLGDPAKAPSERIDAAKKVRTFGEDKGKPAARALCRATLGPPQVRTAALEALEKVHPKLYPEINTLVSDDSSGNHYQAMSAIAKMGDEGSPAVPILLSRLKSGSGAESVLATIAPKEPDVVKAIAERMSNSPHAVLAALDRCDLDLVSAHVARVKKQKESTSKTVRELAVALDKKIEAHLAKKKTELTTEKKP